MHVNDAGNNKNKKHNSDMDIGIYRKMRKGITRTPEPNFVFSNQNEMCLLVQNKLQDLKDLIIQLKSK